MIAEEEYHQSLNEIRSNVKKTCFDLMLLNKVMSVAGQNKMLLESFVELSNSKYRSESGLQADVLKAQVEVSKMTEELNMLNQKKRTNEAKFNSLLYRNIKSSVPEIGVLKKNLREFDADSLQDMAVKSQPALKSLLLKINKSKASIESSQKELLPDFDIGLSYGLRGGRFAPGMQRDNMLSFMLSMNLPFYGARLLTKLRKRSLK